MTTKKELAAQSFSFETVAVLVAVLKKKGAGIGMKDYHLMAELDGTRGASGFDHMFRKVKTRADEIIAQHGDSDTGPAKQKGGAGSVKSKGIKKEKSRSTAKRLLNVKDGEDDEDDEETMYKFNKRVKQEFDESSSIEDYFT